MTTTFVFLGALSEVLGAGIKLTRFGQRVELLPDLADETKRAGGLPCIPAVEFDAIGFTPEQLRKFGPTATHENAPAEFQTKKQQALAILHAIREKNALDLQQGETFRGILQSAKPGDPGVLGTSEVK
jgi:hypothetical protein